MCFLFLVLTKVIKIRCGCRKVYQRKHDVYVINYGFEVDNIPQFLENYNIGAPFKRFTCRTHWSLKKRKLSNPKLARSFERNISPCIDALKTATKKQQWLIKINQPWISPLYIHSMQNNKLRLNKNRRSSYILLIILLTQEKETFALRHLFGGVGEIVLS